MKPGTIVLALLCSLWLGCSERSSVAPMLDGGSPPDAAPSSLRDPFAALPDESEGLTNVSADLEALLEQGALTDACDRYRAGQADRKTMLLCGKWMFFYETFGTGGIPEGLVKFLAEKFPEELGLGFEKLGMVRDPHSSRSMPLGLAPTVQIDGKVDAVAFTCASCHFGRLPDGRYAVGAPNHAYDYGKHILSIALVPALGLIGGMPADHDPAAVAAVQPVLDRLKADTALQIELGVTLLPLLGLGNAPMLSQADEHAYATWPTGVQDFVMPPLPLDDGVLIAGKIIGLWDLPRPAEVTSSGMSGALLAWTGNALSLDEFVNGFATVGGAATPSPAEVLPLIEYIYSLRAPANPSPPDATQVAAGKALFFDKGCIDCHDGPRGSGKRTYTFEEIGTDAELARWVDPDLSGQACCGIGTPPGGLSHGVKSPRMTGLWALGRWLHNGSLSSLEQLFCLDGGRPPVGTEPLRTDGHAFTCEGLSEAERRSLIAYLLAH